jgi:transmembrane sensor
MSRRAVLMDAARWAMREDDAVLDEAPPVAAGEVQAVLDDPALGEALAELDGLGRLSDAEVLAMRQGRRRVLGAGLASVLVALVGIGGWNHDWTGAIPVPREHFETRRGEQMTVALADGSTMQLDGATALDVAIGGGHRVVELQRGEAYFDVAHDAAHPFEVRAGDSGTRVLGTAFTLNRDGRDVKLAVYRGAVRFGSYRKEKDGVVVPAGWRSRFSGGVAQSPTRFDAAQQNWRQSWIDTDDMQLGELVDALNRHRGPEILPPPPELAAIPLAGRFRLDDAQGLLTVMGDVYGFRVERGEGRLRLVPAGSDAKLPSN